MPQKRRSWAKYIVFDPFRVFFFAFYFILFSVYERVYLSRIIKAERILIQYASRATIKCLRALWARESAFVIYFSLCFGKC